MNKSRFTLVELLVVIGIIGILSGLILGGISLSKQKTRVTQARTDMSNLKTAFSSLERDYGRMVAKNGSNYELGGSSGVSRPATNGCITIEGTVSNGNASNDYCNVIAELSDPGNSALTPSLNRRRKRYLDPRTEYDPSIGPTESDNPKHTWLDPWGNPYRIRINVDASERIPDPSGVQNNLSGSIIIWSLGPDGEGSDTNADAEVNKDNIPSWKDGNWLD